MKKTYFTTVMVVSSLFLGLVFNLLGGSALANIFNPSRTVSTAGFLTSPVGDADVSDTITASNYFLKAGDTGTGVWDLGGVDSLEILNGATLTLNATGEIGWSTASNSLKIYDGSNVVAIAKREKCATIPYKDPTSTDDFGHVPFFDGGTLTTVSLNYASGSNAVGWNLHYGRPNAVTTAVFSANKSASASANIVKYTAFTNSTPADGDVMQFVVTSSSAQIEETSVSFCWRE